MGDRVVVVGCGGVGGVVAAGLVEAGHEVVGVTGNPKIAEAIEHDGLTARLYSGEERHARLVARERLSAADGRFSVALLAVPPNAAQQACEELLPHLLPDAPIVCFQNGLIEERLSEVVGAERILGGIVAFGASMTGPGQVEQTSGGGFVLGRLSGEIDDATQTVARLLEACGEVEVTPNLRGARWSKLAINCAISSLGTLGGDRLGALMRYRFVRRLCLEVMTEVTQVAVAEGVRLEKVSGTLDLEWLALDDDERLLPGSPSLFAKHTVLLAVGAKYRRLRSSMLAAIERGREPPVELLNGEIARRGPKHGIPVPINAGLEQRVKALGRGDLKPSLAELRRFFDETRPTLRELKLVA